MRSSPVCERLGRYQSRRLLPMGMRPPGPWWRRRSQTFAIRPVGATGSRRRAEGRRCAPINGGRAMAAMLSSLGLGACLADGHGPRQDDAGVALLLT